VTRARIGKLRLRFRDWAKQGGAANAHSLLERAKVLTELPHGTQETAAEISRLAARRPGRRRATRKPVEPCSLTSDLSPLLSGAAKEEKE
jgi:hypothetical protein